MAFGRVYCPTRPFPLATAEFQCMHFPPVRISDGARHPDPFLFLEHGLPSSFLKFGRPRFCIAPLAKVAKHKVSQPAIGTFRLGNVITGNNGLRTPLKNLGRPRFCCSPLAKWLQSTRLADLLLGQGFRCVCPCFSRHASRLHLPAPRIAVRSAAQLH